MLKRDRNLFIALGYIPSLWIIFSLLIILVNIIEPRNSITTYWVLSIPFVLIPASTMWIFMFLSVLIFRNKRRELLRLSIPFFASATLIFFCFYFNLFDRFSLFR